MRLNGRYRYLRLSSLHRRLLDSDRKRLESLGMECVEEGAEYEIYGIIDDSVHDSMLSKLSRIEWVEAVDAREPPSSI